MKSDEGMWSGMLHLCRNGILWSAESLFTQTCFGYQEIELGIFFMRVLASGPNFCPIAGFLITLCVGGTSKNANNIPYVICPSVFFSPFPKGEGGLTFLHEISLYNW